MGSVAELVNQRRNMEERIRELEQLLIDKDDKIQELTSKLDKYQSIVHISTISSGPRKQRAQGISAEPQTSRSLQDFTKDTFHTFPKLPR